MLLCFYIVIRSESLMYWIDFIDDDEEKVEAYQGEAVAG